MGIILYSKYYKKYNIPMLYYIINEIYLHTDINNPQYNLYINQ